MKTVIYPLLLTISFGLKCQFQGPSLHWEQEKGWLKTFDFNGWGWPRLFTCGHENLWSCQSTKIEETYVKPAFNLDTWKMELTNGTKWSDTKNCILNAVCEKLAGGTNACQYASVDYEKWTPTSCDHDNDYDAITEEGTRKISLACCDDENYCNKLEDFTVTECTENVEFGDYLEALNVCWNDVKETFMSTLLCDEDGERVKNALGWSQNCTEGDGSWSVAARSNSRCRYRPRCSSELRDALETFGECACAAATDNGFTGDFIGTAMETNWQRFCPTIELSCGLDGFVELLYKYWAVRWRFRVALASSAITDAYIAAIKEKIAEKLNVDEDAIEVEVSEVDSTRRRLESESESEITIGVNAEDETTGTYLENSSADLESAIAAAVGATATQEEVTMEEGSDTTTGGGDDDDDEEEGQAADVYIFVVWCAVAVAVLLK